MITHALSDYLLNKDEDTSGIEGTSIRAKFGCVLFSNLPNMVCLFSLLNVDPLFQNWPISVSHFVKLRLKDKIK